MGSYPAAGILHDINGVPVNVAAWVEQWLSSPFSDANVPYMRSGAVESDVSFGLKRRAPGFSLRCVQEEFAIYYIGSGPCVIIA